MKRDTIDALRSLIIIHHDRQKDYEEVANGTSEDDLKSLFMYFSNQSKEFAQELKYLIPKGTVNEIAGPPLKIPRYDSISNGDRYTILSSFEAREAAAKRFYDEIMEHTEYLPAEIYGIISGQRTALHISHKAVRSLYF